MTTIAYRDGIIAADSRISYTTFHNGSRVKVERCGDYLVALAGPTWLRPLLEQWAREGAPSDSVPEDLLEHSESFNGLLVDRQGQGFHFENGFLVPIEADYTAIGSGAIFALGAMAHPTHPASAEEAVLAASAHDKNTGGKVRTWHFSSLDS